MHKWRFTALGTRLDTGLTDQKIDKRQVLYGTTLFFSSAGGLVLEIVAGRLIAPYVGMSLYTWTAIIAVVLAGFSVGHWVGGRLAGPDCDPARGARRLAAALALAAATTVACLSLLRLIAATVLASGTGPVGSVLLLTTALFLLPSLFVGVVSPVLTKLALDAAPGQQGRVLGRMYALGAVGSIAGTLASGYLFISWIGSTGTVLTVGAVYAVLAAVFIRHARHAVILTAAAGTGLAALLAAGTFVDAYTSPCDVESDYYCIRIDDAAAMTGRPSAVMALDHLVHSVNDRDDPTLLFSPYVHLVDELLPYRIEDPRKPGGLTAFFVGGGAYTLPRAWLAAYPEMILTVAEIDPAVTRSARDAMWLHDDARLRIHHGDARAVLQALPREPTFDIVFGDAFHDISVPAHLVTREFAAEIAARLKPDGFYAVNVVDGGAQITPLFLFSVVRTLSTAFPTVEIWIDREEARSRRLTYLVVAGGRPTTVGRIMARNGYGREWVRWPAADLETRLAGSNALVLDDDFAPVDRLMTPVLAGPES